MRTGLLIIVLLALAGAGASAGAQTTASPTPRPTPPPGPLLNKAPDFAAWTIVSVLLSTDGRNPTGKAASGKPPAMVTTITKTNETRHYLTRHRIRKVQDGSQEEVWQQGQYLVTHESMWKEAQMGFASAVEDTTAGDFPEFGWISADNFLGVQEVDGVPCLVFDAIVMVGGGKSGSSRDTAPGKDAGMGATRVHEHACIDLATRLPRLLQEADLLSHYTFQTPPTEMLVLPPADQAMINSYMKDTAARLRPPQHP